MQEVMEVLAEFDEAVVSEAGVSYRARALGAPTPLGHWEGWLDFTPIGGGATVMTDRETTQPNKADLGYWVTGLTQVYLQGALARALTPPRTTPIPRREFVIADVPAGPARAPVVPRGAPILDPFAVYAQGENVLRQELHALSVDHLRTILTAYDLEPEAASSVVRHSATIDTVEGLTERIVAGVKRILGHR